MKKNLLNKIMSRHNKDTDDRQGTWLYFDNEVVGYVTADNEFLDLRMERITNDKNSR